MRTGTMLAMLIAAIAAGLLTSPGARAADPPAWTTATPIDASGPFGTTADIADLSCPSASFCVAVTIDGIITTTTDPQEGKWVTRGRLPGSESTGYRNISCTPTGATVTCAVSANTGAVYATSDALGAASAWRTDPVSSDALGAIECVNTSTVVCLVADGKNVYGTTSPTDGASWGLPTPVSDGDAITSLTCPTSDVCYAVTSDGYIYRGGLVGKSWSPEPTTHHRSDGFRASCPSTATCYSAYSGVSWSDHPDTGASWTNLDVDSNSLYHLSCTHTGDNADECAAIGTQDVVASGLPRQQNAWSARVVLEPNLAPQLTAVSCAGNVECVVSDGSGRAFASSSPTGGPSAWHQSSASGLNAAVGIQCFTDALCLAMDDAGRVTSTSDVAANAWTAPRLIESATRPETAIACPSSSLCVGADADGDVETSTDPVSGAWTAPAQIGEDPDSINALACTPGASPVCVAAAEDSVYTSSNPAGGASTWTQSDSDGDIVAISCSPMPNGLCIELTHTKAISAGGVSTIDAGHHMTGVSCPSSGLCVAIDDRGDALTTTAPLSGTWTAADIDGATGLLSVTCRTTPDTLCAATDAAGNVLTSTDPASGASSWTMRPVDSAGPLVSINCDNGSHCAAGDEFGDYFTATGSGSPTGGQPSPTTTPVATPPLQPVLPGPVTPGPSPTPTPSPPPSASKLATALSRLLVPKGKTAKIGALLKAGGYGLSFSAPAAGTLTVSWYQVPAGAHLARRSAAVLAARGTARFTAPGHKKVKVALTRAGRKLLRHAKHLKLTAKATFVSRAGARATTKTKRFSLRRS